jgi:heterodisulfide reductase subunit B
MSTYLLYPGCSLDGGARAYAESLAAVGEALALDLREVDDWNCCGATEYLGIATVPAYALIGRNLALAAGQGSSDGTRTVVAPCSACYLNLSKCDHHMAERASLKEQVNAALGAGGLRYEPGSLDIRHVLDVIVNDVGLDAVGARVTRPLKGLRVAPYVGCMLPRPDYPNRWSDPEHPDELDRLLAALGADVIDFPLKTHCCGGHMTQIGPATALELIRRLVQSAADYRTDVLVTLCPMCQLNLDAYQAEMNRHFGTDLRVPVLFFTQLMGLAFGIEPHRLGIGRELVDAREALGRIGLAVPEVADKPAPRKRRKDDPSLPMPRRAGGPGGPGGADAEDES